MNWSAYETSVILNTKVEVPSEFNDYRIIDVDTNYGFFDVEIDEPIWSWAVVYNKVLTDFHDGPGHHRCLRKRIGTNEWAVFPRTSNRVRNDPPKDKESLAHTHVCCIDRDGTLVASWLFSPVYVRFFNNSWGICQEVEPDFPNFVESYKSPSGRRIDGNRA